MISCNFFQITDLFFFWGGDFFLFSRSVNICTETIDPLPTSNMAARAHYPGILNLEVLDDVCFRPMHKKLVRDVWNSINTRNWHPRTILELKPHNWVCSWAQYMLLAADLEKTNSMNSVKFNFFKRLSANFVDFSAKFEFLDVQVRNNF